MRVHGASSGAAATEWSLRCRANRCSPAQDGQARQAGPRAVKEKNIPRTANCCSQLPPHTRPFSCWGWKKKKTVLPLEADANGCRILTISCINQAFPKQSLPGTRKRHHGKGVVGSLHAFSVRYWEAEASSASLTRARVWSTAEGVALGAYCLVPAQA